MPEIKTNPPVFDGKINVKNYWKKRKKVLDKWPLLGYNDTRRWDMSASATGTGA